MCLFFISLTAAASASSCLLFSLILFTLLLYAFLFEHCANDHHHFASLNGSIAQITIIIVCKPTHVVCIFEFLFFVFIIIIHSLASFFIYTFSDAYTLLQVVTIKFRLKDSILNALNEKGNDEDLKLCKVMNILNNYRFGCLGQAIEMWILECFQFSFKEFYFIFKFWIFLNFEILKFSQFKVLIFLLSNF